MIVGGHRPAAVMTNQHANRGRPAASEPLPTVTTGTTTGLVVPAGGTWRCGASPTDESLAIRTATEADGLVVPGAAWIWRRVIESLG